MLLVAVVGCGSRCWLRRSPAPLAGAAFVLAGAGMGFGFTRTGVAMLAASCEDDRGFNSSALSIADSIGAALALAFCGIGFTAAAGAPARDPFLDGVRRRRSCSRSGRS